MMNEMVNVMEAGMELMANGASWLFYEATTAQVILVLATLRAIPSLANILETGLYRYGGRYAQAYDRYKTSV